MCIRDRHNVSLAAVIVCPILIALPPRKLDVYTISLLSGTFLGTNQLVREYTGQSIVTRVQQASFRQKAEAPSIRDVKVEQKSQLAEKYNEPLLGRTNKALDERKGGVLDELQRREEERTREKPQWKVERDMREKEAEEEGKGIGDLIIDQVWEVWNLSLIHISEPTRPY